MGRRVIKVPVPEKSTNPTARVLARLPLQRRIERQKREMGACASRFKALKEETNAPVTRETEPTETKGKEAIVVDVKQAETYGEVEGENSRQSLEFLLKEVQLFSRSP